VRTVFTVSERIPPILCRYLARTSNGRRGLTHAEIAAASGLAESTVRKLSYCCSGRGHTIETVESFALACGVNHLSARKQIQAIKHRRLLHVRTATGQQKQMYDRIEQVMIDHAKQKAQTHESTDTGA
jgi:hypothetical protein